MYLKFIKGHIQEKNLINVVNAHMHANRDHASQNMIVVCIQEKMFTLVAYVIMKVQLFIY